MRDLRPGDRITSWNREPAWYEDGMTVTVTGYRGDHIAVHVHGATAFNTFIAPGDWSGRIRYEDIGDGDE